MYERVVVGLVMILCIGFLALKPINEGEWNLSVNDELESLTGSDQNEWETMLLDSIPPPKPPKTTELPKPPQPGAAPQGVPAPGAVPAPPSPPKAVTIPPAAPPSPKTEAISPESTTTIERVDDLWILADAGEPYVRVRNKVIEPLFISNGKPQQGRVSVFRDTVPPAEKSEKKKEFEERMEEFGKRMEEWGEEFGEKWSKEFEQLEIDAEALEEWGEKFGKRMEKNAKKWSKKMEKEDWASLEEFSETMAEFGTEFGEAFGESWAEEMAEFSTAMSAFGLELANALEPMTEELTENLQENLKMFDVVFKEHLDQLHQELIPVLRQDGFIKKDSDRVKITMENGTMKINGKKLNDQQKKKYIDIIDQYMDIEDSKDSSLSLNFNGDDEK